jgi:hypothetical protein
MGMAIWGILVGCFSVVVGLTGKVFYPEEGDTPIPTWLGKTMFIGIGVFFIAAGFAMLWKQTLQQ